MTSSAILRLPGTGRLAQEQTAPRNSAGCSAHPQPATAASLIQSRCYPTSAHMLTTGVRRSPSKRSRKSARGARPAGPSQARWHTRVPPYGGASHELGMSGCSAAAAQAATRCRGARGPRTLLRTRRAGTCRGSRAQRCVLVVHCPGPRHHIQGLATMSAGKRTTISRVSIPKTSHR